MARRIAYAFLLLVIVAAPAAAQCAMCKTAVESSGEGNGGSLAQGLYWSILFMLSAPYLLLGTGAFLLYRARRKPIDDSVPFEP